MLPSVAPPLVPVSELSFLVKLKALLLARVLPYLKLILLPDGLEGSLC